ncbi:MAG: isoaspartyl peptidase/L-asparaginase [Theionarchaea archaeon]|nr:isoaspartyl peptidase/L-asparaginase [Theionarchaea archaeon]
MEEAAFAGYDALKNGSALDAVVQAVCALEDNPLFDAGRGSVLNFEGEVEADAMVMFRGSVGAVGALKETKNPVEVARLVMEKDRSRFFGGRGRLSVYQTVF